MVVQSRDAILLSRLSSFAVLSLLGSSNSWRIIHAKYGDSLQKSKYIGCKVLAHFAEKRGFVQSLLVDYIYRAVQGFRFVSIVSHIALRIEVNSSSMPHSNLVTAVS